MFKMEINGLKEFQKKLNQMEKAAKDLDGTHSVSFSELFSASFMAKHTDFKTFEDFMEAGGFHAETTAEFEAITDEPFDSHVATTTKFSSWEEMLKAATSEYVKKKLGF